MRRLRVVVLTGGASAEREVCLMSGRKVMSALDPDRYQAVWVDLASIAGATLRSSETSLRSTSGRADDLARIMFAPTAEGSAPAEQMAEGTGRPDVVFIALHGGAGEDGTVQGMLELLGIPHTGSGVLASALALNKPLAKKIFAQEAIPTPKWVHLRASQRSSWEEATLSALDLPYVVKPACEGSSIGVSIVREPEQLRPALELALQYGPEALVEEFIEGIEITGPVLGNDDPQMLPLVEIVPANGFYDYRAKYTPGATEEIVPARIAPAQAERARELTLAAHQAIGCRGMSRVDMIVAPDEIYVLELQTIPGLTETSLLPRSAAAAGISFPQLVDRLIELALEERGHGRASPGA